VSGRKQWQKRLLGKEFLNMTKGDTIVTAEFSRIGRDLLNSMSFIAEAKERGIKVVSINGDIPEDASANSTLILAMAGWKNQTERELIAQRTRVGLKAAKERGVKLGRKIGSSKLDKDLNNIRNIEADLKAGLKKKAICAKYKCTMPTLRNYIKNNNILVADEMKQL
jgi:DNA invertase Pin-like site-specific DNA recombinase